MATKSHLKPRSYWNSTGPVTDYGSTMVNWARHRRPHHQRMSVMEAERPSPNYIIDMVPPIGRPERAADSIPVKHLHSSLNKIKYPVNVVLWTPEGRRLLTASSSGEFTLWNGMGFNFETIMQAHDSTVRAACWSHSDDWLISSDQDGLVKYWQPNFNNVKQLQAHDDAIRGMAFSPTDSKFVTGGDDHTLKIFDFTDARQESELTGHQWEVRCLDWHPTKGLIVSGSKDHSVKLWDPRTGRCLTTLNASKNQVSKTIFEPTSGELLATCGRDQLIRIFDLRMMRDMLLLRGHVNEVTALAWHPIHRNLLSSGGHQGAIHHHLLDEQNPPPGIAATLSPYDTPDPSHAPAQTIHPAHSIPFAHEPTGPVWALSWHPLGHILASGSNDRITRFWSRARPGDMNCFQDRYHVGQAAAEAQGTYDRRDGRRQRLEEEEMESQDEAEGLVDQKMPSKIPALPGLPGLSVGAPQLPGIGATNPLPIPPPPLPNMLQGIDLTKMDLTKMDPSALAGLLAGKLPPPPPGMVMPPGFPPPPPGMAGMMPPLPPGGFPAGMFPPPPPGMAGMPGMPPGFLGFDVNGQNNQNGSGGESGGSIRRRGPLPSQQESLQEEMRRGKYRTAK
ncbi:WD40 repeat-like protein [Tothia fuscella]|uniref:Polyadenylation factor subunit 2 n=1 Tax=Tothia fuscella TaxID=1048955 RepID=A0A9P4NU70_9PEZI|nr:WD40 repeat-like protein [Tothia fuscella]